MREKMPRGAPQHSAPSLAARNWAGTGWAKRLSCGVESPSTVEDQEVVEGSGEAG